MRIILATLTAVVLLLAGATTADAHGRGATARPIPPVVSASGLRLDGVITCSTVSVYAQHPDGKHALLVVWVDGVPVESIEDRESSMMSWDDVRPGAVVSAYLAGQEDGDSIRATVTAPACWHR